MNARDVTQGEPAPVVARHDWSHYRTTARDVIYLLMPVVQRGAGKCSERVGRVSRRQRRAVGASYRAADCAVTVANGCAVACTGAGRRHARTDIFILCHDKNINQ